MADQKMTTVELGKKLVAECNQDRNLDFIREHYADDIVSIEGMGSPEMPARMEGKEAILGKNQWWLDNNEVHSSSYEGPYVAENNDNFVVVIDIDITPKGGERVQMRETAIYTVRDGKIAEERFLYPPMES